jgi:hypothetical protein
MRRAKVRERVGLPKQDLGAAHVEQQLGAHGGGGRGLGQSALKPSERCLRGALGQCLACGRHQPLDHPGPTAGFSGQQVDRDGVRPSVAVRK